MGNHSTVVGGSTASRVLACNGSIELCQDLPEEPFDIYKAQGSALHAVMEALLRDESRHPYEFEGHYKEFRVDVTRDMIDRKIIPALDWFDANFTDTQFWIERKVDFGETVPGAFGTADVPFIFDDTKERGTGRPVPGEAGIIDWKFGDGWIVEAEDNDQMRFYLGACIAKGVLPLRDYYTAWIYQPSSKLSQDKYAKKAVYSGEEIHDFTKRLRAAVTGKRTFKVGGHCRNCKGKLRCEALRASLSGIQQTDIAGLDNVTMGALLDMEATTKTFFNELKTAVRRNIISGVGVPGWDCVASLKDSAWRDETTADAALARLGLSVAERRSTKILSPTQAKDVLRKRNVAQDAIDKFWARHVKRDPGADVLKPASKEGDAFAQLAVSIDRHLARRAK